MKYTISYEDLTAEQISNIAQELGVDEIEERDYELDFEDLNEEQLERLFNNGYITRCDDCGEYLEHGDEHEVYDSDDSLWKVVCDDCVDDYTEDDDTGRYYDPCNIITLNPNTSYERFVFSGGDSASDSYRCDCCGELFDIDNVRTDESDNCVCCDCYDYHDYCCCAECGEIIASANQYYDDDTESYYCASCYEERGSDVIRDYHHDNNQSELTFRRMPDDDASVTEYLGVELEVEHDGYLSNSSLSEIAKEVSEVVPWDLMIKHDGSLSYGYEMVSDPCTLRFHLEEFPWENICETNIRNGMRSDQADNCGLHVHVSRKSLGEDETEQDMTIAKLIILFERFELEIEKFSRRSSARWASFYKLKADKTNFSEVSKEMCDVLDNHKNCGSSGNRYVAINLTNKYTIEFRVFKGSLNIETLKATIEFVHEIVRFAKASSLIRIQNCKWIDIFYNTKYPELKSYLKRRDLYEHGIVRS